MVDHDLWGLKLHCDRAFILDGGKIEEFSDLDEAVALHTERLLATPPQRGIEE
jgi:ABC-type polysaccharide/polyol phosphate transport system ATPase subunit